MKRTFTEGLGALMVCVLLWGVCLAADKKELKTEEERINYSIGYQIGGDFQRQGWQLHPELVTQGILDAIHHAEPLMSRDQMNATLVNMKKKLVADEHKAAREADAAFLTENAKKEGVVVLPSGVQYRVIKSGTGKQPTLKDSVTIKYSVSRVDGREIATGYTAVTEPKTYPLNKALPGLREALQLMKEGAVWQIVLPPGPALGVQGEALEKAGVLIYDMELVAVQAGK
ncbi:MAG: FKBP-type peptidyl-prolyl cis-trans isomerase N-terminal domain-containing protein [Thermodesulfobacteriota bacterium]